jgi:DNA-binding XRE family transcriptional regulator
MVFIDTDFEKVDVVGRSKFHTHRFQRLRHSLGENVAAVLHGTHEVVYEECFVVWFFNVLWFPLHTSLVYRESPPMQACGEKMDFMVKSIHTKEYAYFVERLRTARQEAGLTQVQVAKKLKRPQSHISNVESGQQRVDVVELQRFAKLYGKDIR